MQTVKNMAATVKQKVEKKDVTNVAAEGKVDAGKEEATNPGAVGDAATPADLDMDTENPSQPSMAAFTTAGATGIAPSLPVGAAMGGVGTLA